MKEKEKKIRNLAGKERVIYSRTELSKITVLPGTQHVVIIPH